MKREEFEELKAKILDCLEAYCDWRIVEENREKILIIELPELDTIIGEFDITELTKEQTAELLKEINNKIDELELYEDMLDAMEEGGCE